MTGDEVRQVFETMLPQEEVDRLCQQCGVIERQDIKKGVAWVEAGAWYRRARRQGIGIAARGSGRE